MERNIEHFESRLPEGKDTFTRDEVAKLQHSEAQFTERQIKKSYEGYIPQDEYNSLQEKYNAKKEALAPYLEKDFNNNVGASLKKFNGSSERVDDFVKLAGIDMNTPMDEIEKKAQELKESGKYNDIFPTHNSNGATNIQHGTTAPKRIESSITPKTGLLDKLFKK